MKEVLIERKRILLNPSEKGTKYCKELHEGVKLTNEGAFKIDNAGNAMFLTDTQKAYRSGYLAAQKDAQRAFKAKNPDYKRKTK